MGNQFRIIMLLGVVELIILTMIAFYFLRSGDRTPDSQDAALDPPIESREGRCVRGGCSGQLCLDADRAKDIVTTCEYREEYGCYRVASCEVQSDGTCGFTETPELADCLDRTRTAPGSSEPIR